MCMKFNDNNNNNNNNNILKNFGVVSTWKKMKGRPRNLWTQEVKTGMREKGLTTWNGSTEKNGEEKWRRRMCKHLSSVLNK